ncbi:hypothetical protein Apa02nite_016260 [Actinoplanes palleronii]|uniref:Uncharacterized protein n=1 Tax=Actinoplanes palleronii TaxID=113570 RepID=A0ABQ4B4D5_9ACTN|nr:hypothetical protein Apa02nite_016260 [Actinoplanes palleronii]
MLQPRTAAVEELRDGRIRSQRGEQLDPGTGVVADREHGFPYALFVIGFLVHTPQTKRFSIEPDGLVQIRHGYPDVVDPQQFDSGECDILGMGGTRCVVCHAVSL